jgi:DNA primase
LTILRFNKQLLPAANTYYKQQFPGVKINSAKQWVKLKCCFHNDTHPSLNINLQTGAFKCFACETKGDLLSFHQKRYALSFYDAVTQLGAWQQ